MKSFYVKSVEDVKKMMKIVFFAQNSYIYIVDKRIHIIKKNARQ